MHSVLQEARAVMGELIMCSSKGVSELLAIIWDEVYDNNSNEFVGYMFLKDKRNALWVEKGKGYIKRRLAGCHLRRKAWLQTEEAMAQGHTPAHPYKEKTAVAYKRLLDWFREKLLLLMHMVSGLLARAIEILIVWFENTANGGMRNIFASHGQICFVIAYHKNFQQFDQVKIIYHFMPPKVGELLIWYLWLVLPFWQNVEGIIK